MKIIPSELAGLCQIEPDRFGDDRGFFLELWNEPRYRALGIPETFVQDNLSWSRQGSLRGLHFQNPSPQGKLVCVLQGEVFDVAVDLRRSSETFGRWDGVRLSGENRLQLYVPPGFAHGFQVVSEHALFYYKCTAAYAPGTERAIRWDDPALGIPWPIPDPVLSGKDAGAPLLCDLPAAHLFP